MSREVRVNRRGADPLVALVDDDDFHIVAAHSWHPEPKGNRVYAQATIRRDGRKTSIRMHQLILDSPMIDHRNGDGLDNRRANLRPATSRQNQQNVTSVTGNSRFKGVCFDRANKKWKAYITVDGQRRSLGYHSTEEAAALAYDRAAEVNFGEFARLNFEKEF